MLHSVSPMMRPDSHLSPRRLASHGLIGAICALSLGWLGSGLEAQTRASRVNGPARAVEPGVFTHFQVDAEQTQLVHRGRTMTVGQARDRFTSWLELPSRELATAGVRPDDAGAHALVVMVNERGTRQEIAVPSARGATQATPRLLAPRSREAAFGLAWFEGSSLSQRELFFAQASSTDGEIRFNRPVRLAGRAAGSQVALDAVTLADGRHLLTWSAFDGNDTEILFMVGDGSSWSRPRPLHPGDDTPDSFPSLVATVDGALVAWNSLEGHTYSVMIAAFDGTTWSTPRAVVAEPGAEPAWARGADRPILSFRQRDQWTLVETRSDGESRRRAAAAASAERPIVLDLDERGITLMTPAPLHTGRTSESEPSTHTDPASGLVGGRPEARVEVTRVEWQP